MEEAFAQAADADPQQEQGDDAPQLARLHQVMALNAASRTLDFRPLVPSATDRPSVQEVSWSPSPSGPEANIWPPDPSPAGGQPPRYDEIRLDGLGIPTGSGGRPPSGIGTPLGAGRHDDLQRTPAILAVRPQEGHTVYGELGSTPAPSPAFFPIPAPPWHWEPPAESFPDGEAVALEAALLGGGGHSPRISSSAEYYELPSMQGGCRSLFSKQAPLPPARLLLSNLPSTSMLSTPKATTALETTKPPLRHRLHTLP